MNIKCTGKWDMVEFIKSRIASRTELKGVIGVALPTPSAHQIDQALQGWIRNSVLCKFDTTKAGYYIILVKDGDDNIRDKSSQDYQSTCTRLNVTNPMALARLKNVT